MSSTSFPPHTPSAKSNFTATSTELDQDEYEPAEDGMEHEQEDAVHFCLLAEFDIDAGATLAYQYPYPTGTDEHRLAELMLPDGAHLRPEDWTVFYLGQTASSAVAPMLSHESSVNLSADADRRTSVQQTSGGPKRGVAGGGLLYVLNCVRMKEDKKLRRGAMVKALAICTPNPYFGIYKPLLLLALEEYFMSPSPEILARLHDSANAISISGMPQLSRSERILLRSFERKDLFEEKFGPQDPVNGTREVFDEAGSEAHSDGSVYSHQRGPGSSSSSNRPSSAIVRSGALRQGSTSSSQLHLGTPPSREGRFTPDAGYAGESSMRRKGVPKDTHFFETEARFRKITVPIRIPMTVFDEDVGDYSIIELVLTFSHPNPFPPPFHPHLHTNGPATHAVVLIFNALLAHKRVMFLGHGLPANQVARMVLAACAMASGCGQVLRGITETAFPYANLASLDILEEFSGFVAGVTNPRFEELPMTWDVLCNVETGKVTVSKELKSGSIGAMKQSSGSSLGSVVKVEEDTQAGTPQAKMNSATKADCVDNQFMDDILAAIGSHYGEAHTRLRFTDYLARFVRLAAYQEYTHTGSTRIGYPSVPYREGSLGSGTVFADDAARQREMWASGHRVDAWRKTKSYKMFTKDWAEDSKRRAIDFDLQHQIARLRIGKNMSDGEAGAIFSALADGVRSYDQVVELLTLLPPHRGGLMPVANGLFHRWTGVRENALELLTTLQHFPVGRQSVVTMNYFHRKTYLHLLERRDILVQQQREQQERMQYAQDFESSPQRPTYFSDTTSPGTVHGSVTSTPQGMARA